jgi:tRNA nucleotidyltransferase (CCA-adding enzyme)
VTGILALQEQLARQLLTSGDAAGSAPMVDPLRLERIWKLAAVRHGVPTARDWLQVLCALQPALAREAAASSAEQHLAGLDASLRTFVPPLLQLGEMWLDEMPCTELKQLAITGSDLVQSLDRPAGPWIGLMLQMLLERTALNELQNDRETLLAAAKEWGTSHP